MAKRRHTANEVRIIGGKWRGRKLRFAGQAELRPTLGRIRETLFNWLRADVQDARCLDLFAGSGALGFEALSRGAAYVTFIEVQRASCQAILANIARLNAQQSSEVTCVDARSFLAREWRDFDLIFLDPPFGKTDLLAAALTQIAAHSQSAQSTVRPLIYVETAHQDLVTELADRHGLAIHKQTRTAETFAFVLH